MPHILMVLDHAYPPDLRVENEVYTLNKAGFEVTLLSIGPDSRPIVEQSGLARIVRSRIPAQIRNKMRGLAGSLPFLDLYLARTIRKLHKSYQFDAFHAHDLYLFGACIRIGKKLGLPVVGDMHENWVEALKHYKWSTTIPGKWVINLKKWEALEMTWSTEVHHLIVVIEEMAERLRERGISESAMTVVPNTIRLDDFAAWPIEPIAGFEDSVPRLIYTGGMDRHRGLEDVIQALPHVITQFPDVEVLMVGDGAVRSELESLAIRENIQQHIVFTGWQDQEKVKSYLALADVGIIPHKKTVHTDHTIPHKLFHYMYMGLPSVVSNCRPLERIVEEVGCGAVYPSGSPGKLADQLCTLLGDAALRNRLSKAGKEAVATSYNWDATATGLVEVYSRLLGAKPLE